MAAVLACGPKASLSHRSAARLWGIVPTSPSTIEVTRPAGARLRQGLKLHRGALPADEIDEADGIPVTSVSRTLFDLAALVDRSSLERAWNEAEVRRLTSRRSLPELLLRYPGHRGNTRLRFLLNDDEALNGVTKQELEARFAALVDAHGLPHPLRNADIAVSGRFFEVDCLWRAERLIVELDGRAVHGTRQAFEADRERDRLLVARAGGWFA